ncbi:hypothetical protein AOL_s00215g108 [Orbilia oligospora ATCC 24927]|uniref:DNA topoisomerase (ATP-hydrolyzing) n=1 Tax=Arthrobotrys oligospora (strain ATCC 24927 / CBS 115.81 / DSM 1491) TaxID=756982 RepID=G1XTH9_ARTOA|nr:hypothetical protein AOL_s00215g108 [Orbilia oligospora ATCC 24927]EGX43372.1 hypothetical protein AOL_s00215g108 [Orbilia oligospora ATCC 24927]
MSSILEDQYDLELSNVIDLYQNQTPIEDDGSEYFGWSDEDAAAADDENTSVALIDESQFLDLTTPIFTSTSEAEISSTISTDINQDILPPIQPATISKLSPSIQLPSTTQNSPEIPQSITAATTATSIDPATDPTIDPQIPELDIAGRLHKIFLENREDETVTITWEESDNSSRPSAWVLEKIDEVFTAWLDVIDSKGKLVVRLRECEKVILRSSRNQPKRFWRTLVYPGPCSRDNQKFGTRSFFNIEQYVVTGILGVYSYVGAFVRVLELVREAIKLDKIYTKRDIYYKDVALFGSQQTVDKLVDDIASALGVPRRSLHITAAAKGLVCGDLSIFKTDGSIINCNIEGEGVLIPSSTDIEKVEIRDSDTVLIIEKEVVANRNQDFVSLFLLTTPTKNKAIFRTLAESGDWKRLPGRPILICGKGYPDIATRELAHYLYLTKSLAGQYLDFYCLVDYDPHGLDIYTMYKNGSLSSRATGMFYEQMAVPALRHLGVKFCDILEYCSVEGSSMSQTIEESGIISTDNGEEPRSKRLRYTSSPPQGLLPMTAHDRAKAVSMLQRDHNTVAAEHTDDLRKLLFVGYKAEIQVLGDQLVRYLDEKLGGQRIGLAS